MHLDLCRVILASEVFGQGRDSLKPAQRTRMPIESEGRNTAAHLINHIYKLAARMNNKMAWPCPGRQLTRGRIVCCERPLRIEFVYEQFIEAKISGQGEVIVTG